MWSLYFGVGYFGCSLLMSSLTMGVSIGLDTSSLWGGLFLGFGWRWGGWGMMGPIWGNGFAWCCWKLSNRFVIVFALWPDFTDGDLLAQRIWVFSTRYWCSCLRDCKFLLRFPLINETHCWNEIRIVKRFLTTKLTEDPLLTLKIAMFSWIISIVSMLGL